MVQRNNIQNPAEGLMVYQTDSTKGYWYWDGELWKTNSKINNQSIPQLLDSIDVNGWNEIQNITNGCRDFFNPPLDGTYQIASNKLIKGFFIDYTFDTNGYLSPYCNSIGVISGSASNVSVVCNINFVNDSIPLKFNFEKKRIQHGRVWHL